MQAQAPDKPRFSVITFSQARAYGGGDTYWYLLETLHVRDVPRSFYPKLVPVNHSQPQGAGERHEQHDPSVRREERRVPQVQEESRRDRHRGRHGAVKHQATPFHFSPIRVSKDQRREITSSYQHIALRPSSGARDTYYTIAWQRL